MNSNTTHIYIFKCTYTFIYLHFIYLRLSTDIKRKGKYQSNTNVEISLLLKGLNYFSSEVLLTHDLILFIGYKRIKRKSGIKVIKDLKDGGSEKRTTPSKSK